MKTIRSLSIVLLTTLATLTAAYALAEERYLDFLHRLHEKGFGEIAVQYLKQLDKLEELPDEVRDVWELEMGNSLRISADEAANPDQAQQRLAEAEPHLEKFLKDFPDHPESAAALGSLGDIASLRGQIAIKLARASTDKAKQEEYFKNARAAMEQSRPRFAQSVDQFQARLRELAPTTSETPKKDTTKKSATGKAIVQKRVPRPTSKKERDAAAERQEVELNWLDARFKLAMVDFYVAQTFSDANNATRKATLLKSAKGFDNIFQQYRTFEIGLYAHMWEGKSRDELGDLATAEAIYDEVLVNAPDPTQPHAVTGMEPLFAQVELFRLLLLIKKGDQKTFLSEATEWLRFNQASRTTAGYQGIAFELAKAQIAQAEKATGEERRRMMSQAVKTLGDIGKVRSDYQQEAIVLRRKYQVEVRGAAAEIATFDEGLTVGDEAAGGGQWPDAAAAYAKAVEFGDKVKDQQRVVDARYRLAHALYMSGKMTESLDTAESIAHNNPGSPTAPRAGALAVQVALAIYASVQDKAPALDRLTKIANYTSERWPERPEADDARIALGQSNIVRGDLEAAIGVFERVSPQSERYPLALFFAGQAYWRGYLSEKQKLDTARNTDRIISYRAKAQERLLASLEASKKAPKEGEAIPKQLADTQLLLSELYLEGNEAEKAVPLLQPLVDAVKAAKPQSVDTTTLRTLVASLRAYVAVGELAKAGEVEEVVVAIGSDNPQVNSVLVEFAKLLGNELKKAEAAVIETAKGTDKKAIDAAQANQKGMQQVFVKLLDQLATRQQHTLANMIYIGDSFAKVGEGQKAREQYQRVIKAAEADPSILPAKGGQAAILCVRAQLVGLLRDEGKYEEALKEVTQLIDPQTPALELLMEKGRVLQAWAEKEPKRYDEAIAHWTNLRTTLSRMQRKPPEYYEVIYNAATCLLSQSKQTKDKAKALQAEQLLKSTLVLSPNLSGPDMVAKYKAMLDEAMKVQGRAAQTASAPK